MAASLKGKVVAISGAASGMGFAMAVLLYSHGVKLSLTDNRKEPLEAAVATLQNTETTHSEHAEMYYCVTDVRLSEQVDAWIAQTVERLGGLDGAVNLAGVIGPNAARHDVATLSDEEWAFVSSINLTGTFYAVRAQVKAMREAAAKEPESAKTTRSIVNAASTAGLQGNAYNAVYSAAKHGVVGLTRSVAKETGRDKIRINAVAPYVFVFAFDFVCTCGLTY